MRPAVLTALLLGLAHISPATAEPAPQHPTPSGTVNAAPGTVLALVSGSISSPVPAEQNLLFVPVHDDQGEDEDGGRRRWRGHGYGGGPGYYGWAPPQGYYYAPPPPRYYRPLPPPAYYVSPPAYYAPPPPAYYAPAPPAYYSPAPGVSLNLRF